MRNVASKAIRKILRRHLRALKRNDAEGVEMAELRLYFKGYTLRTWKVREDPRRGGLDIYWMACPTYSPELPFDLENL